MARFGSSDDTRVRRLEHCRLERVGMDNSCRRRRAHQRQSRRFPFVVTDNQESWRAQTKGATNVADQGFIDEE
jgi:hypothetical protein